MGYFTGEGRGWRTAVWVAILVAVGAAVLNGVASNRWRASRDRTARSEGAMATVTDLRAHLVDAETGQRGYLLTGDDQYLSPYVSAQAKVQRDLAAVQSLIASRDLDPERATRLLATAGDKMRELDSTIVLRRANRGDLALQVVRSDRGRALMDSARAIARQLLGEESTRLAAGREDEDRSATGVLVALLGGALVSVGVLLYLLGTLQAYDATQRAARREMERQLADLETLMRERFASGGATPDAEGHG